MVSLGHAFTAWGGSRTARTALRVASFSISALMLAMKISCYLVTRLIVLVCIMPKSRSRGNDVWRSVRVDLAHGHRRHR